MDPLSDLLSLLQVEDASTVRFEAGGQWAVRGHNKGHVYLSALIDGPCWLMLDDTGQTIRLEPGDCLVTRGCDSVRLCSDPATKAPDQHVSPGPSKKTFIQVGTGSDTLLTGGRFTFHEPCPHLLSNFLPKVVHIKAASKSAKFLRRVLTRLADELDHEDVGKPLMINHLAQVALLGALRAHMETDGPASQGWLAALADERIGKALRLMHDDVARRWTVADLGQAVGMSRSKFALRFKKFVAAGPLEYLLNWRMGLAIQMLRKSDKPISTIAFTVGYESESAFSTSFKRVVGTPPSALRDRGETEAETAITPVANGAVDQSSANGQIY